MGIILWLVIGGVVMLESQPGRGTMLQLRVPMTLTIIPA